MKLFSRTGALVPVVIVFMLIALFGLAPVPHTVGRDFEQVLSVDDPGGAAHSYARLAAQMPWWPELWEKAGHDALQNADPENAIVYFQQASQGGPLTTPAKIALGDAHHLTGDLDAAVLAWSDAGQHPDALRRLADSYIAVHDYGTAIPILKTLRIGSQDPALYTRLGLLLAAHQPGTAPPFLLEAAELDGEHAPFLDALRFEIQRALPRNLPAYTLLISGRYLASAGYWDLAAHAFARAASLRPDFSEAWAYLGEAQQHLSTGDADLGLEALTKSLSIDPSSIAGNTLMALYWQRHADFEMAQKYIQTALISDQRSPALYMQLGELVALDGDLSTAQSYYQAAVDTSPRDSAVYQALAEFSIRYHIDIRTVALPAARQAVLLSSHDAAALDTLGQVLFVLGDSLNAERFYQRSLGEDPTYGPAHLHLGILYLEGGFMRLAHDHLEHAALLAPGTGTAAHARRLLAEFIP
ncbi:MAG: tetratricopeptide repeat protein [Chloroflexota bacterium]